MQPAYSDVLGDKYAATVKEATYEFTDPTRSTGRLRTQGQRRNALIARDAAAARRADDP